LQQLLNPEGKLGLVCEDMIYAPNGKPILRVDGGFGAASEGKQTRKKKKKKKKKKSSI
jgi:hypothetical protein